jgi:hypothetical protein
VQFVAILEAHVNKKSAAAAVEEGEATVEEGEAPVNEIDAAIGATIDAVKPKRRTFGCCASKSPAGSE